MIGKKEGMGIATRKTSGTEDGLSLSKAVDESHFISQFGFLAAAVDNCEARTLGKGEPGWYNKEKSAEKYKMKELLVFPPNPTTPLLLRLLLSTLAGPAECEATKVLRIYEAWQGSAHVPDARIRVVVRRGAGRIDFVYHSEDDALSFVTEGSLREVLDTAIYQYHEKFGDDCPFEGHLEFQAIFRIGQENISIPIPGCFFWNSHFQTNAGIGLQNL